jgi:superfamily II DNA or RNA helicase
VSESYRQFVETKTHLNGQFGFDPIYESKHPHPFQNNLIEWALKQGRAAVFADCGLGKTLMQLVWAENVYRKTNKPVLILAPLSVSSQTVEEAQKFDIEAIRSQSGAVPVGKGIITTNYERLHYFSPDDFSGVVCDESSILKNFDGAIKAAITQFMRKVKYRAMFTATPSPNDYTELGTSSEALGDMPYMDMLQTFFKSNDDTLHPAHIGQQWRFKGHAEPHFWRWVASWARAIRKPSDLGFSDDGWSLPALKEIRHEIQSDALDGQLFAMPVSGLPNEREERKATIKPRCERAADLITAHDSGVAWCHFNAEAEYLEDIIPGAVNLSGSDSDDEKEEKFVAFKKGQIKYLITKPKIAALGVNWQHSAACTYFDDYSYEQYYQAVRRFWRFGQKRDVTVYQIGTTSLANVAKSRKRKSEAADEMFRSMMHHMVNAQKHKKIFTEIDPVITPSWLREA